MKSWRLSSRMAMLSRTPSVKELDSPEQAQEHATKQAAGKLKKGYQESDINENIKKTHRQHG